MPNGIYTRREAKYKVYETIQNITDQHLLIRYNRTHVDSVQLIHALRANHANFATRARHRIAVPSCALDWSLPNALSRQLESFQPY